MERIKIQNNSINTRGGIKLYNTNYIEQTHMQNI